MRDQDQEIHEFMDKYRILEYEITSDGVDVQHDVNLYAKGLTELPFQFNVIHGNFACSDNKLESLRGAPRVVHGSFYCDNNKIKSLHDVPKFIQGVFTCYVNSISPWEYRYLLFSEVRGGIKTETDELNAFFRKYKNKKALIPEALKELRTIKYL